jgi:excisionase family DNA binding protein
MAVKHSTTQSAAHINGSTTHGDRIMDSAEAAAYINVSRKTLLRYCKAGLISYIPYRGKHQFRKSALDYFVSKNEVKA